LRRTGASTGDYLTSRNALLVAGGAGGNWQGTGGNGGTPNGGNGTASGSSLPGLGATQTGPGAGQNGGQSGSGPNGGTGATFGGGGGGGYYGGGGGGTVPPAGNGGGGGGSSFVMATGSSAISYATVPTSANGTLAITALAAAPTLTGVTPNPGGLGQSITLTGTNLSSPTALTINGANALGNIISNNGTSLVVRVPATAAATGTVSITTAGGGATIAFSLLAAPGNALALAGSGTNDYVRVPDNASLDFGAGDFTVETWVYKAANSSGFFNSNVLGKWNTGASAGTNEWLLQTTVSGSDNLPSFWVEIGNNNYQCNGTQPLAPGRWYHLAGVRQGSNLFLYVNGVLQATLTGVSTAAVNNVAGRDLLLGAIANNGVANNYANERLDEVRIWNTARTAAQLQAGMTTAVPANSANLVAYYNFDAGTASGSNAGLATLYDLTSNANHGTLNNVALTGSTSNWVESYAMVVPTATAATSITGTSFTANWTAPSIGTVDNGYRLDVSTSNTFASGVTTYTVPSGTTQSVTGLAPGTLYYYRVRADKTSVTGQGAYSATVLANTTLTPPGNALAIDGGANYVEVNTQAGISNLAGTGYTIEAWIYLNTVSGVQSVIRKDGDYNFYIINGLPRTQIWSPATTLRETTGTTALVAGRWYHVAGTYDGTNMRVFLNGVDVTGGTNAASFTAYNLPLRLGRSAIFNEPLNGRMDEVRIYNTPLTQSQIQADMLSTASSQPANLQAYYNFDQGTASGNNTGLTALYDVTGAGNTGTLYNFALTGSTSNWVESYAMVVPTATAASGITGTGFTANWTAPSVGTVTNYLLDVSTSNTFATVVSGSPFTIAAGTTSRALTGLLSGATYYYRVRADKTSVTGQGAYSATISATTTALTPPGNALAFDGNSDEVRTSNTAPAFGTGDFTLEAWVRTNTTNTDAVLAIGAIGGGNDYWLGLRNGYAGVSASGTECISTSARINDNRWHHLSGTRAGGVLTVYVDGVAVGTRTNALNANPSGVLGIGSFGNSTYFWPGSLDEVRVWNVARTQAQLQAAMTTPLAGNESGLLRYYNFDQGTASGTNTGLTTLPDLTSNASNGTLYTFALTGNNSNWVESYAMVVPTATAATAISSNTFTANWTAPAVGTVTSYLVDVATDAAFASPVSGSPFTQTSGTSLAISGVPGGTLYYRVRADKTSVTGQGAPSNAIAVTVPSATLTCAARANNALNFDGSNDYVHSNGTLPATGEFTLETWVNPTTLPGGVFSGLLLSDNFPANAMHWQLVGNTLEFTVNGSNPTDQFSSFTVPTGTWSHLAVVYSASARTVKFFLNGTLMNTATYSTAAAIGAQSYSIGGWLSGSPQRILNGSLNEMRVWSVARTDAQIAASCNQALAAQTGLAALYSFDQGIASGNNAGLTTLNDDSGNGRTGTLNAFALTGTVSNWVAGNNLAYTLSIASFSPAGGSVGGNPVTITGSGFLGATGVAFNGTAASFTVVNNTTITANVPAGATSGTITVTGPCGTVTSSTSFTVCPLPVAITKSATVVLNASGNGTVTTSAINNGSTAGCGFASGGGLSVSPATVGCSDVSNATTAAANTALAFNGTSQYVEGTHALLPQGNAPRSIEAWVYPTAYNGVIFNYGAANTNQRSGLLLNGSGQLYYVGENNDLTGGGALSLNTWHHVAASYNGTTMVLYVDGVQTATNNPSAFGTTGNNWRIGQRIPPTPFNELFSGRIDEVRVWNRALTAGEVTQSATRTNPTSLAGLVGRWDMREGSGSTLADMTGNSTAGTLVNAPTWVSPGVAYSTTLAMLSVTDVNGNVSRAAASVTVLDNTAPTAVAQNVSASLNGSGSATVTAAQVNNNSTDNCSVTTVGLLSPTQLVTNGTFVANATSWTLTNGASYSATGGNPDGYIWLNASGAAGTDPTATQTLTGLTVGTTYLLSGSYRNVANCCGAGVGAIAFGIDISGTQVAALPDPGLAWTPFSRSFTATATSQTLAFRGEINGTDVDIAIDNISVRAISTSLTFNCAQLGANPVALVIGDASNNYTTANATVTVQDATAPTAVAQSVSTTVNASGRAYVSPVSVNNGSTDNCGITNMALSASSFGSCAASAALNFDGADDYSVLPVLPQNDFTLEYWMKTTQTAGGSTQWYQGAGILDAEVGGVTNDYGTALLGNKVAFGIGNPDITIISTTPVNDGNWHHVAATRDATTGIFKLYVDGVLEASSTASTAARNVPTNMVLGAMHTFVSYFQGQLDEVRVWSTVRTAAEIALFRDKAMAPNSTGLLAYYDMNDAPNSTTIADRTAAARTATLNNFTQATAFQAPGQVPALGTGPQTVTLTVSDQSGNVSSTTATVTVTVPTPTVATWASPLSNDWFDCRNWQYGTLPSATTDVVIPTVANTLYPVVGSGTGSAKNLTLNSGAGLTVSGGAILQVNGDWTNNGGTANLPGTVAFTGTTTQNLGGTTATSFGTLVVNKASGNVQMAQNLNIATALTTTSGILNTNASTVTLGSTATLNSETDANYVNGNLLVTRNLNTSGANTFGGIGLSLNPVSGNMPGNTTVRRVTGTALTGVNSHQSVQRYFDIQPAVNTGLNVTMVFNYFNHELNGIPTANLALFKSVSSLSGPWQWQRPVTLSANAVTKTGITDFSIWTLGNSLSPLPVELREFTATAEGSSAVRLAWSTASEKNNAGFTVERSVEGTTFAAIGSVAGAGTSNTPHAYGLLDTQLSAGATVLYYRLKQTDTDGTANYSPVRTVMLAPKAGALALYPNPATNATALHGAQPGATVLVLDALGRTVATATADASGTAALALPTGLASGVYVVRTNGQSARLVVE